MFGSRTPWVSVVVKILGNQMGTLSEIYLVWQQTAGIVDMWQEGNIEVSSAAGDWQVR